MFDGCGGTDGAATMRWRRPGRTGRLARRVSSPSPGKPGEVEAGKVRRSARCHARMHALATCAQGQCSVRLWQAELVHGGRRKRLAQYSPPCRPVNRRSIWTMAVGRLRARCLAEYRCTPTELRVLKRFSPKTVHRMEIAKVVPLRYPSNEDSVGIEIVGAVVAGKGQNPAEQGAYETVSAQQNVSLRWLIAELTSTFGIPMAEIFRHPIVSRKNPTEAKSALW